jgi:hypothetical protein
MRSAVEEVGAPGCPQAKFFFNFGDRGEALYCDRIRRGEVLAAIAAHQTEVLL